MPELTLRADRIAMWRSDVDDRVITLEDGEVITAPRALFERGAPQSGDYLLRHEDGTLSWASAWVFENRVKPAAEPAAQEASNAGATDVSGGAAPAVSGVAQPESGPAPSDSGPADGGTSAPQSGEVGADSPAQP